MTRGLGLLCLLLVAVSGSPVIQPTAPAQERSKLLYILLDGFKWDYVDQQSADVLPGFTQFLQGGVKAKWTDPLFPSISYPTWTSLSTGLYGETHGIVGNYFFDPETKETFSLYDEETTGKEKWWTSEPIWTTAQKAGLRTAQYLWSRCDVPIDGVVTEYCEYFVRKPGKAIFEENIMKALDRFEEGFDFVQVYTEHADNFGHDTGPDSVETRQAVRDLDDVLVTLMEELEKRNLQDIVNIVIVSDHGMANTAPGTIARHEIDDYLDTSLVENLADKGAFMNMKVPHENVEEVFSQVSQMPGVRAYKHDDIPERFHFKDHKYIHEIILLAETDNFIMPSKTDKQIPRRSDYVYMGAHGFDPESQDMKGIFYAKGPAFKSGWTIDPIHVVDVYQVLAEVLNLTPRPHNGTWSHVDSIFNHHSHDIDAASTNTMSLIMGLLSPVVLYFLS